MTQNEPKAKKLRTSRAKKPLTIPAATPLREVLDALDEYMYQGMEAKLEWNSLISSRGGHYLWYILTAMRGPDREEEALKQVTIHIRHKAFPKIAARVSYPLLDPSADLTAIVRLGKELGMRHWASHVEDAATVLETHSK